MPTSVDFEMQTIMSDTTLTLAERKEKITDRVGGEFIEDSMIVDPSELTSNYESVEFV